MDFHKIIKYLLSVVFIAVIGYAVLSKDDTSAAAPVSTQPQPKFNF